MQMFKKCKNQCKIRQRTKKEDNAFFVVTRFIYLAQVKII